MVEDAEPTPAAPSGPRVTVWGVTAYVVAAAVILIDQLVKFWVLDLVKLQDRTSIHVLPIFQLTMVWNPGVSFGLLRADSSVGRWILVAFAAVVVGALAFWARRASRALTGVALGLVMGGAVGNNLIDRVRFGAVADFLDFHGLYFPWVFNVADSAICIGVALLLLDSFLQREPREAVSAT